MFFPHCGFSLRAAAKGQSYSLTHSRNPAPQLASISHLCAWNMGLSLGHVLNRRVGFLPISMLKLHVYKRLVEELGTELSGVLIPYASVILTRLFVLSNLHSQSVNVTVSPGNWLQTRPTTE